MIIFFVYTPIFSYIYIHFINLSEKADLFNSIYSYELKLEEEQSKQWMHEDEVIKCTKCETTFGWTLRKVR